MQRLIKVVQTSSDDKGAKYDLLHLSLLVGRTLQEAHNGKKEKFMGKGATFQPWCLSGQS